MVAVYNLADGNYSPQNTPHCYIKRKNKVTHQWIYQYGTWKSRYNYRGVISYNQFTNKLALVQC